MSQTQIVGMDDLLDGTLDDLADAPSFKPFAIGVHRATIKWETKTINELPAVELSLKHLETVELKNPEDTPPTVGDETSVAFMLKKKDKDNGGAIIANELAQGQWKDLLKLLKKDLNLGDEVSNRAVMEATNGMECMVVTDIRIDKRESKTDESTWKHYTVVKSINTL